MTNMQTYSLKITELKENSWGIKAKNPSNYQGEEYQINVFDFDIAGLYARSNVVTSNILKEKK